MKPILQTILLLAVAGSLAPLAAAKDKPIGLGECPAPVQAVIRQYSAKAAFESVAFDEKKKSGGAAVYEAKFNLPGGKRIELHISPTGTVMQVEEKTPKS